MLTSVGLAERVPRPGEPSRRPPPAARRRLGAVIHQPERRHLSHAGRRRSGDRRHRTRHSGRAAPHPDARLLRLPTHESPLCSTAGITSRCHRLEAS